MINDLQVDNINLVKTGIGKVLVKPLADNSEIKFGNNTFYLNATFQKEKHSVSSGEVISSFNPEIQKGDIAVFHYLSTLNAIRDKKYLVQDKEIFYSVNCESVYLVKRGEQIIPVNDYILVEPIKKYQSDNIDGIFLPKSMIEEDVASHGIVRYISANEKLVKPNDKIIFRKSSAVPIEFHLHQSVGNFFRMKDDSVLAIDN